MVTEIVEEAGKKGVKLAVIITAGFKEIGEEGKELQDKILQLAQKYGIRMVGPQLPWNYFSSERV